MLIWISNYCSCGLKYNLQIEIKSLLTTVSKINEETIPNATHIISILFYTYKTIEIGIWTMSA